MNIIKTLLVALILSVAALFSSSAGAGTHAPGWELVFAPPAVSGGIWGTSENDFYVAGANWISHFDGAGWTLAHVDGEITRFWGIWGSGADDVYAFGRVGTYGKHVHSALLHFDGTSWSKVLETPEGHELTDLWVTPSGEVFAVDFGIDGSNSTIYRFDGYSWDTMEGPDGESGEIWASGPSDIYVRAEGGLHHYDGASWQKVEVAGVSTIGPAWGTSADDVYAGAVDENGHFGVIHFDGSTWSVVSFSNESGEGGLGKLWKKGNNIYVVFQQHWDWGTLWIYHTDTGTWSQTINTAGWLDHIWGTPESGGPVYVAGTSWAGGGILFTADGWGVPRPESRFQDVWGADAENVFFGGRYGEFFRFDGSTWHEISTPEPDWITGIWGFDADDVYLAGWNGLYRYHDGSVETLYGRQDAYFSDIWGTDGTNLYLSGGYGIFHWNGSYGTWVNNTDDLNAIWGSSGADIFAVGDNGRILHFDGSSWVQMESGTDEDLEDVWGSGPEDVYAVGDAGTVLHYDGTAWSKIDAGTRSPLNGVWGSAPDDVFVGGSEIVLHFDGESWSKTVLGSYVTGLWGDPQGTVFAGADGGVLRHPYGSTVTVSLELNGMGTVGYGYNMHDYCDTDCSFGFNLPEGGFLHLHPEPAEGYIFTGWGGNCSRCNDNPFNGECDLVIDSDITCIANFQPNGPPVIDAFSVQPDNGTSLLTALFTCKVHDLDTNDTLKYVEIYFGDGLYYETYSPGGNVTLQIYHTYAGSGTYDAYCEAEDQYDHRVESDHEQVTVGTGPRIDLGVSVFSEDFSQGIPEEWDVVDAYGDNITWGTNDSCERDPGGYGFSPPFALVDYSCRQGWAADDSLVSPEISLEGWETAPLILSFADYLDDSDAAVSADVDISTDNGTSWRSILHSGHSDIGPGTVRLDLSPFLSGASSLRLRYHYHRDYFGVPNYWLIDDISILSEVDSIHFGTVSVGEELDPVALVVKNTGSEALQVQSLSLEGDDPGDFRVTRNTCTEGGSFSLQPGESCSVSIAFAPTVSGKREALLSVVSNDPQNPSISLRLVGNGTSQAVSPVIDSFTAEPISGDAPLTVTFTCHAYDPDGGIIESIEWFFDSGQWPDYLTVDGNFTTTHTYDTPGVYVAHCRVWDDDDQNATSGNITITVNTPIVNYELDVSPNPEDGGTVTGDGINCPGDCNETYEEGTSVTLTATPNEGYEFSGWSGDCAECEGETCTIQMDADKTCTANFELVSNEPPVIDSFTAEPTSGDAPLTVNFTCEAHDNDGNVVEYCFDFDGDGENDQCDDSTNTATFTYNNPGIYQATCTVTDDDGESVTSEPQEITINEAAPSWVDITDSLNITHSARQLYDRIHRCFFIQVTVENPGEEAVSGPVRLIITDPSIPVKTGVGVGLEPDGYTDDGDPYFIIISDGESLGAGEALERLRINFKLQRKHLTYGVKVEAQSR